jgi:hypothetical protein
MHQVKQGHGFADACGVADGGFMKVEDGHGLCYVFVRHIVHGLVKVYQEMQKPA